MSTAPDNSSNKEDHDLNNKEDRAWLDDKLIIEIEKRGSLSHFEFTGFHQAKTPAARANLEVATIHTLGFVDGVDLLSAASLMELGMHMAFSEICDLD